MARYVVMQPADVSTEQAVTSARIIRDGFSVPAFLIAPIWLLWHGLFVEMAVAIAVMLGAAALAEFSGLGAVGSLLSLLFSILIGLEGQNLRLAALARRGWREWGVVEADNIDEAEIRYVAAVTGRRAAAHETAPQDVPHSPAPLPPRRVTGPALGLLHYPGTT